MQWVFSAFANTACSLGVETIFARLGAGLGSELWLGKRRKLG